LRPTPRCLIALRTPRYRLPCGSGRCSDCPRPSPG
jgi:hypothetical protein